MMSLHRHGFLSLGVLGLLASAPMQAANHLIEVGGGLGLAYEPSRLVIDVGDTVTFRNLGGFHNAVSVSGGFRCANGCDGDAAGSGNASSAMWEATRAFNTAGVFDFYCEPHGAPGLQGMSGQITVRAANTLAAGYTGTWFDPAQNGHGIFIEILPGDLLLAYWFTFLPDGGQAWLGGVGPIVGNTASVPATISTGARFIPNFHPNEVVRTAWGTLNFSFSDCSHGRVDFDSVVGFGNGSMNLQRLTAPAGLTCTDASTTSSGQSSEH